RPWITHRTAFADLPGVFASYTQPQTGVIKAVVEVGGGRCHRSTSQTTTFPVLPAAAARMPSGANAIRRTAPTFQSTAATSASVAASKTRTVSWFDDAASQRPEGWKATSVKCLRPELRTEPIGLPVARSQTSRCVPAATARNGPSRLTDRAGTFWG